MDAKQDFTSGSIFGKMMQFMIPILGAQILQAMYGAVDMLVVGHFGPLLGTLVDEQHDDIDFGMVVGDGVDDRLHS